MSTPTDLSLFMSSCERTILAGVCWEALTLTGWTFALECTANWVPFEMSKTKGTKVGYKPRIQLKCFINRLPWPIRWSYTKKLLHKRITYISLILSLLWRWRLACPTRCGCESKKHWRLVVGASDQSLENHAPKYCSKYIWGLNEARTSAYYLHNSLDYSCTSTRGSRHWLAGKEHVS